MCDAVQHNSNWQSGNTSVIFQDGLSSVYLHGNLIAEIDDCSLKLFDGDHQTKTTKSRLNALLSEFGYTCGTQREMFSRSNLNGSFVLSIPRMSRC